MPEVIDTKPSSVFAGIRYRSALAISYMLIATLAGASYFWQAAQIDESIANLARERGSVLFRLIELTRDWNAGHGGVYVPVSARTQPNIYLKSPRRDVVTTDGQRLTLVNPAYMTRQIAEIAEQAEGVHFHITSTKLVRPENAADAWELESLQAFASGQSSDRLSFFANGGGGIEGPVHRFMAPLLIKEACLKCHDDMGYKIGDIRGGISVSMPAEALLEAAAKQRTRLAFASFIGFAFVAALAHLALYLALRNFVAWQTRERLQTLETITRDQEALIAERTRQLSTANAALADEVREVESSRRQLEASQASSRAVVESIQDGVVVVRDGGIVFANERMAEMLGYRREEMVGHALPDLIAPEERDGVAERLRRRFADEFLPAALRLCLQHADGITRKTADVLLVPHRGADGATQLVVSFKDVSEKLSAERELMIASTVFERASEGIIVTDRNSRILQVNPAFTTITGYSAADAIGQTPRLLRSGHHDATFYAAMRAALLQDGRWEGEVRNRHKNGEHFVEWLRIATIPAGDSWDGGFVATISDITQRKMAEDIILHQASHDPLTDLPNRRLFEDRLEMTLAGARRHRRNFALLYADLDHFKEINDLQGHTAGDALLSEVARRMVASVRADDTVARLGGDEFAILLNELETPGEVTAIARRLVETLGQPFAIDGVAAEITVSIGIALHPRDGDDAAALRKCADLALYAAKAAGRNCWCSTEEKCGEKNQEKHEETRS